MITRIDINGFQLRKVEIQIIKMICRQLTTGEIAEKLGMSKRTVEDLRQDIVATTKSKNTVGVVLFALKHGLFEVKGINKK